MTDSSEGGISLESVVNRSRHATHENIKFVGHGSESAHNGSHSSRISNGSPHRTYTQVNASPPQVSQLSSDHADFAGLEDRRTHLLEDSVDIITTELRKTFSGRHRKKNQGSHLRHDIGEPVLLIEMTAAGENQYKSMHLRELLDYVNGLAEKQDQLNDGIGFPSSNSSRNRDGQPINGSKQISSAANPLRLRDLRRLESSSLSMGTESAILVRWHCVLFALDPIQAVIMHDRLILVVPDGADTLLSIIEDHILQWVDEYSGDDKRAVSQKTPSKAPSVEDLPEAATPAPAAAPLDKPSAPTDASTTSSSIKLRLSKVANSNEGSQSSYVPFEMHAYDTLMTTVAALEKQEYLRTNFEVQTILKPFQEKGCILSIDAQEQMRRLKNHVSHVTNRLQTFQRALDAVVEDDEAMALMNLSLILTKPRLYKYPLEDEILGTHEEVEELIENYLNDYHSLEGKLEYLKAQMQSAEELVSLRLDTARNQLLVANTAFAVLSCSIALGAFITGIFGMNLDNVNTIQNTAGVFNLVCGVTSGSIVIVFSVIIWYLRYTGILPSEVNDVKPL